MKKYGTGNIIHIPLDDPQKSDEKTTEEDLEAKSYPPANDGSDTEEG